jgi:RimJ/RimL family protein N-acetyltransferase
MVILETQRLMLRPHTMDDLLPLHELLDDPEVWQYDPGFPRSIEERRDWLVYRMYELRMVGVGCFAVQLKSTNTLIGRCGLEAYLENEVSHDNVPYNTFEVELYYHFGRRYWGQGYASEAALAIVQHAFQDLKLRRLVTPGVHRDNVRSRGLMQRIGMNVTSSPHDENEVMGILNNPIFFP